MQLSRTRVIRFGVVAVGVVILCAFLSSTPLFAQVSNWLFNPPVVALAPDAEGSQSPQMRADWEVVPVVEQPASEVFKPLDPTVDLELARAASVIPHPPYEIKWADPSNYGDRYIQDISGNPTYNQPIIVLHETVYSVDSAINYFQTPHTDESLQASYHTLIRLNGTVVYVVPPEKRAFGAGNSVYVGPWGPEAIRTHQHFPASVNNFAYHVSLETPLSGRNDALNHSGYTDAQYRSLAWLIAQSTVPDERITTHRDVDRSGERIDPRNFDRQKLLSLLHQQRLGSR
ncbi:MAG: peptidoglycan recognition family protein [Cyanobacteria bacterium P01_H01_bin.121]